MLSYTAPSGAPIYGGREPSSEYAWATGLPQDTWVQLPSMRFYEWATGPAGIYQAGYRGTNPINSMVNAFCDPATDPANGDQYFFGGGHGDGSCNAIAVNRGKTLGWEKMEDATPPSAYLPGYLVSGSGGLTYPGGAQFNERGFELATFFLSAAEGLDAQTDAAYIAPKLARASTHMYQAAIYRRSGTRQELHYFYKGYSCYDLVSRQWSGASVNLEGQLALFKRVGGTWKIPAPGETGDGASLGTSNEVWGVSAIDDPGTDRAYFLVTGGGYRNHVAQFNYDTQRIEAVYPMFGVTATNASFFCRVDRKLYVFANEGTFPKYTARRGYIFDLDTKEMRRFDTTGASMPQIVENTSQETIPGWYDSTRNRICRWNYGASFTTVYPLDLTPVGGAGTHADPDLLVQSTKTVAIEGGDFPAGGGNKVACVYGRLNFIPAADCVRVILRSDAAGETGRYWALRLS